MIIDARSLGSTKEFTADVCIAGAGFAGITLANTLSALGKSVVLLEAGGREESESAQAECRGEVVGLPYDVQFTRYRMFGGTAKHWSGYCAPLDRDDFEAREWIPQSGWPIDADVLEPYYTRAQCLLGFDDSGFGIDANAKPGREPVSFVDGIFRTKLWKFNRVRFGEVFAPRFERDDKIRVLLHAPLQRIEMNEAQSQCESILCRLDDGSSIEIKARHYVLACGGLETPRVLLTAGPEFKPVIDNDNIGRHFMEHFHLSFCIKVALFGAASSSEFYQNYAGELGEVRGFFELGEATRRSEGLSKAVFKLANTVEGDDLIALGASELSQRLHGGDGALRCARMSVMGEQIPNAESRVSLSGDTDSRGVPQLRLDWRATAQDNHSVFHSAELFSRELARAHAGRVRLKPAITKIEGSTNFRAEVGWGAHHMGTTRMSTSPRDGVVDANCRVHGVDNLHIAGSSVFTTSGVANPTMTLIALAMRLGDRLGGAGNPSRGG